MLMIWAQNINASCLYSHSPQFPETEAILQEKSIKM